MLHLLKLTAIELSTPSPQGLTGTEATLLLGLTNTEDMPSFFRT